MNGKHTASPRWSTSSFSNAPDTLPRELDALCRHLNRCTSPCGALSALRRAGEAVNDFAAHRLMTTLALFALLAIIVSLLT